MFYEFSFLIIPHFEIYLNGYCARLQFVKLHFDFFNQYDNDNQLNLTKFRKAAIV